MSLFANSDLTAGIDPEEILKEFFGGGMGGGQQSRSRRAGAAGQARRGDDVQASLTLDFMEAVEGCKRDVSVQVQDTCNSCSGTGSASKSAPSVCPACNGTGEVHMSNGFLEVRTTCTRCSGAGRTIRDPCTQCGGRGTARKRKTVEVSVPPGVDNGITMRLAGQGDSGQHGAPSGHLYVSIRVREDSRFERDGSDVHVRAGVPLAAAVLGGTVTVPTVGGEVELKVPPGSQPSDKLLMRGRGIRKLNGSSRGDQYVHLRLKVPSPSELSERQIKGLRMFAGLDLDEEGSSSSESGGDSDSESAGGSHGEGEGEGEGQEGRKRGRSRKGKRAKRAQSASSTKTSASKGKEGGANEEEGGGGLLGEALKRLRTAVGGSSTGAAGCEQDKKADDDGNEDGASERKEGEQIRM